MTDLVPVLASPKIRTFMVREQRVMLDQDLAALFGVETKRLNEQVRRNRARFDAYAFHLNRDEFNSLRSQIATSEQGPGGRRHPPWAFTEHGVVMAATVLNSDAAIAAMKLVIEVFVTENRRHFQSLTPATKPATALLPRLQGALEGLLDSVADHRSQATVREEAQELLSHSIQHLKDRLNRPGLENEEIAARAAKLLAEAEASKADAAKTQAEANEIELRTLVRRIRLVIEAEKAMTAGDLDNFLSVLHDLSRP